MRLEISPVYLLRAYAWQVIKANTHLREADYGGLVPLVPLSEEKELSEYNKPHIVYGYALHPSPSDLSARHIGSMTFAVYSTNFKELTSILTALTVAFERKDKSARDVNEYTSSIANFIGIRFGMIELAMVEGGTPEDSEGGRQSGLISIRFEFYTDYTVKTKLADFV